MTDKVQKITQALAEAQLQSNNTAEFIKTWKADLTIKNDRIEKLKADLAEAKKPTISNIANLKDILADLTAMSGPVGNYKVYRYKTAVSESTYNLNVAMKSDAVWLWSDEGKGIKLQNEDLSKLIITIIRMQRTLKAKQ